MIQDLVSYKKVCNSPGFPWFHIPPTNLNSSSPSIMCQIHSFMWHVIGGVNVFKLIRLTGSLGFIIQKMSETHMPSHVYFLIFDEDNKLHIISVWKPLSNNNSYDHWFGGPPTSGRHNAGLCPVGPIAHALENGFYLLYNGEEPTG